MTTKQTWREDAAENRRQILETEAVALALLLLLRKKKLKSLADEFAIAEFEAELAAAIYRVRAAARTAAGSLARRQLGLPLVGAGLLERLTDVNRSKRIAENIGEFVRKGAASGSASASAFLRKTDRQLARAAVTENSVAYNEERRKAISAVADKAGLIEIWDAELDQRTCETCLDMDGAEAVDGRFPGGFVPGAVHPWCRCTSYWVRRDWIH